MKLRIRKWVCESVGLRERLENSRGRLYRVAFAWCHDPDLADDLVQECQAKAWLKLGQLKELKAFDTWLLSILANTWRDYLRRRRECTNVDELIELPCEETPESLHGRIDLIGRVRRAIAGLPMGQREVVTLVDLEGFSYVETAESLGIPVGTVMSRLSRARNSLKQQLIALTPAEPMPDQERFKRVK